MSAESDLFPGTSRRVLTVAELTRSIRGLLETRFGAVWVQGEISNYKKHPSGHQYFTLKDQRAAIACVIFRNTLPPFPRPLADGMQVQVYGNVTVFEARGQYQLSVQILQSRGLGLLQAKFEALKRKLEAEGLFDQARKRALPKFPRRIGIVTSSSGAAIQDILNILRRRAPGVAVLINPVRVQGTGAALEIATAIRELSAPNDSWKALDVLVVARGGGSIEDLWEFNEEIVARAIFHSAIPVVSAVGHEVDFTIADFVADLRAPTPSAAAELVVPDVRDLERRTRELENGLGKCCRDFLERARARLSAVSEKALFRELSGRLRDAQQQLDLARESLLRTIERRRTTRSDPPNECTAGLEGAQSRPGIGGAKTAVAGNSAPSRRVLETAPRGLAAALGSGGGNAAHPRAAGNPRARLQHHARREGQRDSQGRGSQNADADQDPRPRW